jgi:hypothetical protein
MLKDIKGDNKVVSTNILQEKVDGINSFINAEVSTLNNYIGEEVNRLDGSITSEVSTLNNYIGKEVNRLDGSIDSEVDTLNQSIRATREQLNNSIRKAINLKNNGVSYINAGDVVSLSNMSPDNDPEVSPDDDLEDYENMNIFAELETLNTELINTNKAVNDIQHSIFYATPQMYGAKGDGLTDDTDAINDCLHSNKYVFIPNGFYKISYSLNARVRDGVTVKCDNHAIFIANTEFSPTYIRHGLKETEIKSMLLLSDRVGYSGLSGSWEGGIFCCNGVKDLTGIKCTKFSTFITIRDVTVIDIGDGGIGVDIYDNIDYNNDQNGVNNISGKQYLDNIRCFGQTFYIGGILPRNASESNPYQLTGNTQIDVSEYNNYIKRNNIGMRVQNCYDFSIGTIYVMSCRIGIEANKSEQVNVHYYHYWQGTDGSHTIKYDDYITSRAFKGDAYWHFDMFYPDKPYIAFEGNMIDCDNTHYICPHTNSIVDNEGNRCTNVMCYLGQATQENSRIRFGNFDINQSVHSTYGERLLCGGILTEQLRDGEMHYWIAPYYTGGVQIEPKFLQYHNYLHPSWTTSYFKGLYQFSYVKGSGWVRLGYVCTNITGNLKLKLKIYSGILDSEILINT